MRHIGTALALAVVMASPTSAGATTPPRATEAVLSTGLSVEWSGVTGLRLRVPATARLPHYGFRLTVRGASYASVRLRPTSGCPENRCQPYGFVDHLADLAPYLETPYGPGTAHIASFSDEGRLRAGLWEVFLFTDGVATMTFDDTGGLRRAPRTVRAAGRVRGVAQMLPVVCPTATCTAKSGYGGRLMVGGATHDIGSAGSADMIVMSFDRDEFLVSASETSTPQTRGTNGCAYPGSWDDTSSAAVEDHQLGCDVVTPRDGGYAVNAWGAARLAMGAIPTVVSGAAAANHYGKGAVYLGYQHVTGHDVTDPAMVALGVWYTHGVR